MSQTPQKSVQKMCKSPKNTNFQVKQEKIDYEHLSTNCTVVGSNNLNLVKKPQIITSMSPAYSNPSPNYPPSPYSSPASLKSPSPSLKPPTPQPSFPVMQIIHNNLIGRPIQTSQPQNIIKLKPHLNILPKPSASPQPSPKPSVSPQIVIPANQPAATIMPTAQPLLLNQMPMLTAPGVQFILRPQTAAKLPAQMQTATATPQGLILQPGGQQLLQLQPPRSQPMVRVLTNGMQLAPSTTTYVTQMAGQPPTSVAQVNHIVNSTHHHHQQQQQQQQQHQHHHLLQNHQIQQVSVKKKPKTIKTKKKLDLANIMKLSGIGDEDDIQFESDTSQSENEHTSVPTTPQPHHHTSQPTLVQTSNVQAHTNYVHSDAKKNIQNIHISAMAQPTINTTPVVQVLNQNFQSGMISNSSSQAAAAAQASIPFNSFITPNVTINNGLMLQRFGGFKLTVGEDGRLVLQHDPTLNQDLQSQLILQSLLGLNGGLVLQPSMDQQTVQQTVQTIQQQSVQTIQQQTVQSQTIQTVQQQTVQPQVQHTIQSLQPQIQQQTVQQTIQHQTVNALQQPMQIVQPQPIHSLHSQVQPTVHSISQSQVHSLQSQIQSLLQQQNHLQTHTVHQNPNVHSQAMQNVQNIAAQNVQNIAAQNVQNIAAQNVQNIAAQNVQNLTAQNVQNIAAQNVQNIAAQNVQNIAAHNLTAQNVQNIAAQNLQNLAAQNVQNIAAQNVQNIAAQNVQNIATQNIQNISAQNVQNIAAQNVQNIAAQNVQNIAAQNVQNIAAAQNVQQQNMQAPVHSVQSVQGFQQAHTQTTQPVLKVQPFQKSAPPVQTVQPIQQQHQSTVNQPGDNNGQQSQNNPPTSYVVNLTPEQLERLKRNGQLTVNGQTIFMQRPTKDLSSAGGDNKKLSPKVKPAVRKVQKCDKSSQQQQQQQRALLQESVNDSVKTIKNTEQIKGKQQQVAGGLNLPSQKVILPHNHVQPIQSKAVQPQAMVQPSVQPQVKIERQKSPVSPPKQQKVSPTVHSVQDSNGSTTTANHDVDKFLGQFLEETNNTHANTNNGSSNTTAASNNHMIERQPQQRITTIQLTPQKQQHLKTIQMQIQALSARSQPGDADVQKALKSLFEEQQKILASGKLLPPDKVYYHNNQLTIVNPSSLNLPSPGQIKSEPQSPRAEIVGPRTTVVETQTTSTSQPVGAPSHPISRVSVSVATSTGDHATQTVTPHHHTVHHHEIQRPPISPQQTIHHHPSNNHQNHPGNNHQNHPGNNHQNHPSNNHQNHQNHPNNGQQNIHNALQNVHAVSNPQPSPHVPSLGNAPVSIVGNAPASHGNVPASLSNHAARLAVAQAQQQQQQQGLKLQQLQPTQAQQASVVHFHPQSHLSQQQIQQQHAAQQQQHFHQHVAAHFQQQQQQQQVHQFHSYAKKAHLIETQLNLDQNGAIKPDIHTPFRDKKDACIRLIRYHCMDQPVLSQKDLDKADEIFELTARHFIGKFEKMVDKYKYLLMKESMRQVRTSELMMLNRLFLADEQQSLIKLRQDYENELLNHTATVSDPGSLGNAVPNADIDASEDPELGNTLHDHPTADEYDEWACIQRELGCLPDRQPDDSAQKVHNSPQVIGACQVHSYGGHNNLKRTSSSDSRLETLKRFRVDKHTKRCDGLVANNSGVCGTSAQQCNNDSLANSSYGSSSHEESENNSIDEQVQSAIDSILNLQQNTALDLDSILS